MTSTEAAEVVALRLEAGVWRLLARVADWFHQHGHARCARAVADWCDSEADRA